MESKGIRIWIGIIAVAILVVLGFVFVRYGLTDSAAAGNGGMPLTWTNQDHLDKMLEHRSKYMGDASNAGNLLAVLPYGDQKNGISLKTDSPPYGITVNYELDNVDKIQNVKPTLLDNALILFALIENVEIVNFHLDIAAADSYEFQFTRAEMQQYFEQDLWSYSNDKGSFEEFLKDISFEIVVFPEKYSLAMSSVPGMRIEASLNAAYYKSGLGVRYSAKDGSVHTWGSDKVSEPSKIINLPHGEVYWSPLNMIGTEQGDTVTISILDKEGNVVSEKQISIVKDGNYYTIKPSYDVLTDNFYQP